MKDMDIKGAIATTDNPYIVDPDDAELVLGLTVYMIDIGIVSFLEISNMKKIKKMNETFLQ